MNDFAKRIEKNLSKKKENSDKIFEEIIMLLCKEGNMSVNDILEAPTPFVISVTNRLSKLIKKANKK